jgi:3-oxoacyl-[acyl-carrier-protein] synthase II
MSRRIAIVAVDCLMSAGTDLDQAWDRLVHNGSGISPIRRYEPGAETLQGVAAISYAGQIPLSYEEMAGSPAKLEKWREPCYFALQILARRLFERLGFDASQHRPQRIAVLGGTALTSQLARDTLARTQKADSKYILHQCTNIPLAVVASEHGLMGPCFSVSSACASSGHAMLMASHSILAGMTDCALVFGYEFPLLPTSVGGLDWINALYRRDEPSDRGWDDSAQASRPLSQDRRGFVVAEGAGAVFLSDEAYAREQDWPILGCLRGAYSNSDADHLTRASQSNVALCMRSALENAGCNLEDVGCVNAHATSTPIGDAAELTALAAVFGDRLATTPVVANKSQIGHSLGASTILALILALRGMREGVVLPTLNHVPDPSLPAAWIPAEATAHEHDLTLLNSFGFGGTNVSLVVERGPD